MQNKKELTKPFALSYDDLDTLEDKCELFRKKADEQAITDGIADFNIYEMWPRLNELKYLNLSNGIEKYLGFLMFWSTQELDSELMSEAEYNEFRESKKIIKQILYNNLEVT